MNRVDFVWVDEAPQYGFNWTNKKYKTTISIAISFRWCIERIIVKSIRNTGENHTLSYYSIWPKPRQTPIWYNTRGKLGIAEKKLRNTKKKHRKSLKNAGSQWKTWKTAKNGGKQKKKRWKFEKIDGNSEKRCKHSETPQSLSYLSVIISFFPSAFGVLGGYIFTRVEPNYKNCVKKNFNQCLLASWTYSSI